MCGRAQLLMLLLFAANAHRCLWVLGAIDNDELKEQLNRIENDQLMQVLNIKSLISRILQANDQTADRLGKMETSLESVGTQVRSNAHGVMMMLPDCQRWLQWAADINISKLFSAYGKHFYHETTTLSWYKARDWCSTRGMRQASLKTLREMQAVSNKLKERGLEWREIWVSASDIGRTPGQFYWPDGTLVDKSTWNEGDPNDYGTGKPACVYIAISNATFCDHSCSDTREILCEVPAALAITCGRR